MEFYKSGLLPIISAQADTFVGRILQRVVKYGQAKPARSFGHGYTSLLSFLLMGALLKAKTFIDIVVYRSAISVGVGLMSAWSRWALA